MRIALLGLLLNGALIAQTAPSLAPTLPPPNNPTVREPLQAIPAQTARPVKAAAARDPVGETSLVKLCEQQRLKIRALEGEREKMVGEIQRLQDEIRRLNEMLSAIRSRAGNDRPAPTS